MVLAIVSAVFTIPLVTMAAIGLAFEHHNYHFYNYNYDLDYEERFNHEMVNLNISI